MLIDSHCHVHFPNLAKNLPSLLANMKDAGVARAITVGTRLSDVQTLSDMASGHDELFATVGVHPNTDRSEACDVDVIAKALDDNDKFVAVGECGLDYHYNDGPANKSWQLPRMMAQAELALERNLPLVVHTRDSVDDTIDELSALMRKGLRAVMHCFTGQKEQAVRALDAGFMLSFTGIVTFNSAKDQLAVAAGVPIDRLMVETDAPYLAPTPHRGKTNEPAYVRHTADRIAAERKMEPEEFARATTANATSFFGLPATGGS